MRLPPIHPHLLILRSLSTVLISAVIGQAGWAAAGLGDDPGYFRHHQVGAYVTLAVAVAAGVGYVALWRTAGPVLVGLAVAVAVLTVAQVALGVADLRAVHIFTGVLTAMLATALTSWTYRHPAPVDMARRESAA